MAKRDKISPPIVTKTARGLSAVSAFDAERIMADPAGTEYDLVKRTKRSWPQLKTYWKALGMTVNATGKWPNAEKLHRDIKFTLGYVEEAININTGEITISPDSVALDKMSHDEFCRFMNQAMELLARRVGSDPLSFLDEAA